MSSCSAGFARLAFTIFLAIAAGGAAAGEQKSPQACGVDEGKYLNLAFNAFDQTMGGGWREIADKPGCQKAAADLVAKYRDQVMSQQAAGLDFHEAQLRAAAGETATAISLFKRDIAFKKGLSAHVPPGDALFTSGILFTEATVAFLERDRPTLQAKRDQLAALPKPEGFDALAADFQRRFPEASMTWPPNLWNVDAYLACFDKPYSEVDAACYGRKKPGGGTAP